MTTLRNTLVNRVYNVTAKVEAGDKHIEESRTKYETTSEGQLDRGQAESELEGK